MFRPCIDLHDGKVKQIVGGSLTEKGQDLVTNFESEKPPEFFAELFRQNDLKGGHVIRLGGGNEEASLRALSAYPGGLQIGGGISPENALNYLERGASHVIVTSWLFDDGQFSFERLKTISALTGAERLVVDLSCRVRNNQYVVVTNRWQTWTTHTLCLEWLETIEPYCAEFLIHAVDVEGLCRGIDLNLVKLLADITHIPVTYAGGAKSIHDLKTVEQLGGGRIHLTIGSALDIFGGKGVRFKEAVNFNAQLRKPGSY